MDPATRPVGTPGTELRLAMGMRGGVSLAVWMGGACSEVDRLRRSAPEQDPSADSVYRWLLDCAGFSNVAVDVLAGASAGGLNGVLMSCSVVHGMTFGSDIRNLWLQVGDLGSLVRTDGGGMPASLLDGDKNFYGTLARALPRLVGSSERRPENPPRLDTILTCTLLSPAPRRRFQDLGPPITERRNRAWFRFRSPGPDGAGSDFGTPDVDLPQALDRLAYAARATSSFPGAFEAASVGFAEDSLPPVAIPVADGEAVRVPATHHGIYSESRPRRGDDAGRDHVIDGGVLDNIPLAWAVRAIAGAPADRPVDRWLLYLQPVPFAEVTRGARRERPRTHDVVSRARQLQGSTEALADDLDELQRLRRDGQRRRGFAQVLEYALGQLPRGATVPDFLEALSERGLAARDRYRERAGEMEAGRIRELWTDPLAVLGADPLGFRETTRDPLPVRCAGLLDLLPGAGADLVLPPPPPAPAPPRGAGDEHAEAEGRPASEVISAMADELLRFRSPQVLARTVSVLLDAARELDTAGLGAKDRLYGIRRGIELLIARADRSLAALPASLEKMPETSDVLVGLVQGTLPGDGGPDWSGIWAELVAAARQVADAARQATGDPAVAADERAFLGCLVKAADFSDDPDTATKAVLAVVELLTGPLRPDPLAETTPVKFHMISAVNPSPLVPAEAGNPASAGKLAGNQLRNFGAFLSARWRLNDWIWGRLDSSSSLVDVLLRRFGTDDDQETESVRAARLEREADLCRRLGIAPGSSPEEVRLRCVTLLHEQVLRDELPLFRTVDDAPPSKEQLAVRTTDATGAPDTRELLATGREGLLDLARRGRTRLPDLAGLLRVGAVVAADSAVQGLRRRAGGMMAAITGDDRASPTAGV